MSGDITFGPGLLESIRLERRRYGARRTPGHVQLQARARGTFRVFCGAGNDHTVTIKGGWYTVAWPQNPGLKADTTYGFMDPYSLGHELVEYELEDWSDPCEVGE